MITVDQQINRLFDDWCKYKGIVIAVDVDDTIMPYRLATQRDCDEVIDLLRRASDSGALLCINTACNADREKEIRDYCETKGLKIEGYNKTIIDVPYGKTGSKIYANIYIDDRGAITEGMYVLTAALYMYRGWVQNMKPLTEIG